MRVKGPHQLTLRLYLLVFGNCFLNLITDLYYLNSVLTYWSSFLVWPPDRRAVRPSGCLHKWGCLYRGGDKVQLKMNAGVVWSWTPLNHSEEIVTSTF